MAIQSDILCALHLLVKVRVNLFEVESKVDNLEVEVASILESFQAQANPVDPISIPLSEDDEALLTHGGIEREAFHQGFKCYQLFICHHFQGLSLAVELIFPPLDSPEEVAKILEGEKEDTPLPCLYVCA